MRWGTDGVLSPANESRQKWVHSVDEYLVHGWCRSQKFVFCTHENIVEEQGLQSRNRTI